jgi:hypothetical protein
MARVSSCGNSNEPIKKIVWLRKTQCEKRNDSLNITIAKTAILKSKGKIWLSAAGLTGSRPAPECAGPAIGRAGFVVLPGFIPLAERTPEIHAVNYSGIQNTLHDLRRIAWPKGKAGCGPGL